MISILILLLVGVASSRHVSYYDNDSPDQPIITKSQERRICAELCMSGLGGEPCGEECSDVIPQGLPTLQSQSEHEQQKVNYTRRDACPVLCANRLGYPLCNCDYSPVTTPFFRANYYQICSHFCLAYRYQIYGCDECFNYNMTDVDGIKGISGDVTKRTYDWNEWCIQVCQEGDGGSACYCDLLPFALKMH